MMLPWLLFTGDGLLPSEIKIDILGHATLLHGMFGEALLVAWTYMLYASDEMSGAMFVLWRKCITAYTPPTETQPLGAHRLQPVAVPCSLFQSGSDES